MRSSPEKQEAYLTQKTDLSPSFQTYHYGKRPIHYLQIGDSSEMVIIFLHGSPGSSDAYMPYLADTTLLSKALLISVDRPGFGYSGFGKAEPSLRKQSEAFEQLLMAYQKQKVILVGHSFGGPLAARLAMDYPELIDGIVMVAPSISPELEPSNWWRHIANIWGLRWLAPAALRVCNQEILPLKKELKKMMPMWEKVDAEVTVIQGTKDKLVPMGNAYFAEKMLVNSPKVTIDMVEEGNHFILWSEQERVTNAILVMMSRL